jgi:DNA-binding response OmpR family regulator
MYLSQDRKTVNDREQVLSVRTPIALVCISERDSYLGRFILEHLERAGFGVRSLSLATDVIQRLEQLHPSLVIMRTTGPSGRMLELFRRVRCVDSLALIPVVLLASNPSEEERILSLESGADDYIAESSSGREVVARVRAVMRRFARQKPHAWMPHVSPPFLQSLEGTPSPALRLGDIEIDSMAMKISVRGMEVVTTNLEFRFLHYLVQNHARVFTREQLLDAVWGSQYVELRSVDACVRRLRRKIELDPLQPAYLRTIRGAGYCFLVSPAGEA